MRVIGIDPGLRITGYACIDADSRRPTLVEAGVIRLVSGSALPSISHRLEELSRDLGALLDRLQPHAVAVEGLFAHYKHPATAVVMAHARGVALLAIHARSLTLLELKPAEIKKAVTGTGRATKLQVQRAVQNVFSLPTLPEPPDVADALAIALCARERLSNSASRAFAPSMLSDQPRRFPAPKRSASSASRQTAPLQVPPVQGTKLAPAVKPASRSRQARSP
ncbi:MAG: crossover junction endodeoxyribonuclease RuvC [Phycisphaeraceae bacterium]|nr:crossover junction endodeoxyribonuclease RuvC [Phycisphaeraceae bacterium]MCW5764251.1 crossover junction endodeoxyribonuclease RuvC [Phycisphaeraceae bacterium]